jgi:hypothetical protein
VDHIAKHEVADVLEQACALDGGALIRAASSPGCWSLSAPPKLPMGRGPRNDIDCRHPLS